VKGGEETMQDRKSGGGQGVRLRRLGGPSEGAVIQVSCGREGPSHLAGCDVLRSVIPPDHDSPGVGHEYWINGRGGCSAKEWTPAEETGHMMAGSHGVIRHGESL